MNASTYCSDRARAWRNAMVAAINAGLDLELYGLEPGDNRWRGHSHTFAFAIGGIPALGFVSDAGWDELHVTVALWPTPAAADWMPLIGRHVPRAAIGEVIAAGWVERRDGVYLQSSPDSFGAARTRVGAVAALVIEPDGYADAGRLIL